MTYFLLVIFSPFHNSFIEIHIEILHIMSFEWSLDLATIHVLWIQTLFFSKMKFI